MADNDVEIVAGELRLELENFRKNLFEGQKAFDAFMDRLEKAVKTTSYAGDAIEQKLDKPLKDVKKSTDDAGAAMEKAAKNAEDLGKAAKKSAGEIAKAGEQAGKRYVAGFSKGADNLNKKLNEFVGTMNNISPKMGALGEKMAQAFSKPMLSTIPMVSAAFQAMLPVIGTIIAAIAGIVAVIKKAVAAQKEHTAELIVQKTAAAALHGEYLSMADAEEQVKAKQLEQRNLLAEMTRAQMAGDREQYNRLAERLKLLNKELESLSRIGNEMKRLQAEYNAMNSAVQSYAIEVERADIIQRAGGRSELELAKMRLESAEEYKNKIIELMAQAKANKLEDTEYFKGLIENYATATGKVNEYSAAVKKLTETETEAENKTPGFPARDKEINLYTQAQETYGKTLAQIKNQEDAYFIDSEEAMEKRLLAERQYIQTLSGLRDEYNLLGNVSEEQIARIAAEEAAHIAKAKALETALNYQRQYAAETKRLTDDYEKISAEMDGQITFAEMMMKETERRTAQLERQREAELEQVRLRYEAIAAEREGGELTEAEIDHRDALTAAINKNYDAMRKLANTKGVAAAQGKILEYMEEISKQQRDVVRSLAEQRIMEDEMLSDREKQLALNEMSRQAALEELNAKFSELEAQREGAGLTEEEVVLRAELTQKINENYIAIARGINAMKEEKINFKELAVSIAEASVSAFTDITSAMTEIARNQAQRAIEDIEWRLENLKKDIEDERKNALEAEGFIEAQRAENMQAQIDAAVAANDEVLQYQLERRQREMEINEEYDAKAKEAEDKAKKEKAKLEYEAAMTSWEMKLAEAAANLPMTIMNAIEAGWNAGKLIPVPGAAAGLAALYAGLAGTAAGFQIQAIRSNPPQMPKFATGGIVPGNPAGASDTVAAMLTPGEVILNRAQQGNLAPQLNNRPLIIQNVWDGRKVSETVIDDYVNKGIVLIDASRGIR